MRICFSCLLLLFVLSTSAQKGEGVFQPDYKVHCVASFQKIKLNGTNNTATIESYLQSHLKNLESSDCTLQLNYRLVSLGGIHYSFTQRYKRVEIYQSEIKVNTDKNNVIRSIFDNSFATDHWDIPVALAGSNSVIVLWNGKAVLAERKIEGHFETISYEEQTIYRRDVFSYFSLPDSLVWGKIFLPDPLTSAQQNYGGIYADHGDSNATWLMNQLQTVSFMTNFNGTEFTLTNRYVQLADFDSPNIPPVTSTTNQFFYNRSQSGFEDVNAFYHLNVYRQHVHDLGYSIADDSISVDTHAFGGADQSAFVSSYDPPRIYYGIGGVDDAEDADVITHEYGHFLSFNAAPGSNIGNERNSLDEAFGDYVAASYSKAISLFHCDWVFNWDGHNEFWSGRVVNSTKVYPTDLSSSIYQNSEIWSAVLMSIHDDIGRNTMDSLIYETHFSYAANITMPDAAQLLIDADSVLFHGVHYCPIYRHLLEHGLVPFFANNPCGINGINEPFLSSVTFRQDGASFHVNAQDENNIQCSIWDMTGAQITTPVDISHTDYEFENSNLPPGIYLVVLRNHLKTKTFKWCKTQ